MTKEVVLQMIWDRHFDLCMEKDLDDICEDIYNEVFVPLLKKALQERSKEILDVLLDLETPVDYKLFYDVLCDTLSYLCDKYGVYAGNYNELAKKYGWEVE